MSLKIRFYNILLHPQYILCNLQCYIALHEVTRTGMFEMFWPYYRNVIINERLVQYSLPGCGTTASGLNGTITSLTPPQRQLHFSEYKCRWNIELQETAEPRHVELTFVRFNMTGVMPKCLDGDYIELFLGCNNSKSIGKFCGQTLLPVVYSSDHCLQIVFHFFMAIIPRRRSVFQAIFNQRLLSTGNRI